jgi:hypothetical protein
LSGVYCWEKTRRIAAKSYYLVMSKKQQLWAGIEAVLQLLKYKIRPSKLNKEITSHREKYYPAWADLIGHKSTLLLVVAVLQSYTTSDT